MRPLLGALLLVPLLLAGCGDDEDPTASDPAPSGATSTATPETATDLPTTVDPSSGEPTRSPPITPGGVPFELVELVDGTAGRGQATDEAVPIASAADAKAFASAFSPDLAGRVEAALAAPAPEGTSLYAAVVGMGCDIPPGVDVTETADGYAITGLKVADPLPECFAPVTTVAVVAIGS
ncbi:hypothetical protein [Nocardioides sp.]|uniref:hypothetical protein n=1 Tax=Nocardioides sp. TaxID=35761 RepID=UPI00271B0F08|nr:hypothetical protein [Nocardioides sp.]MDO9456571.1 hypothetical protein [Nocardioides sp.]